MTDDEYQAWLADPAYNASRILLCELNHTGGSINLASESWMSESNIPYYGHIMEKPYMENSVDNLASIGNMQCLNLTDDNWENFEFYGHHCVWLYGDRSWTKDQFVVIGCGVIEAVRRQGRKRFEFDLLDLNCFLRKTFYSGTTTRTETVSEFIEWLEGETGLSIGLENIPATKLAYDLRVAIDDDTTIEEVLRKVGVSIAGYLYTDTLGNISLRVRSTTPDISLTENHVILDGITTESIRKPYKTVKVTMGNGTVRGSYNNTGIDTNRMDEELNLGTYLDTTSEADAILAEYVEYFANTHYKYNIDTYSIGLRAIAGDEMSIVHPELTASGLIHYVEKQPLSKFSTIGLTV